MGVNGRKNGRWLAVEFIVEVVVAHVLFVIVLLFGWGIHLLVAEVPGGFFRVAIKIAEVVFVACDVFFLILFVSVRTYRLAVDLLNRGINDR